MQVQGLVLHYVCARSASPGTEELGDQVLGIVSIHQALWCTQGVHCIHVSVYCVVCWCDLEKDFALSYCTQYANMKLTLLYSISNHTFLSAIHSSCLFSCKAQLH